MCFLGVLQLFVSGAFFVGFFPAQVLVVISRFLYLVSSRHSWSAFFVGFSDAFIGFLCVILVFPCFFIGCSWFFVCLFFGVKKTYSELENTKTKYSLKEGLEKKRCSEAFKEGDFIRSSSYFMSFPSQVPKLFAFFVHFSGENNPKKVYSVEPLRK